MDKGKDKEVISEQEDAAEDEFFDSHEYTPEEIEVPTQHSYSRYFLNDSLTTYRHIDLKADASRSKRIQVSRK